MSENEEKNSWAAAPVFANASVKDNANRETRLSFRKFAENQMRNDFKADAMEKCDLQLGSFAECIKVEGLMAPFKCKSIKNDVDDCMRVYNSEERFRLYVKENEGLIDKKPFV